MTTPVHLMRVLPALLRPYRRIFLLSHMRAYTSLFGHILGSHPDIEGYYEFQIGYHSWRSLIRQKLHYFYYHGHSPKRRAQYLLDKILHNDHRLDASILNRPGNAYVFCLRPPDETIPSIIQLYQRIAPGHRWTTESGAFDYYMSRLTGLEHLSENLACPYLYMDAECLTNDTTRALTFLTYSLNLTTPLEPEYHRGPMTGQPSRGDPSERIESGRVVNTLSPKPPLEDERLLSQATNRYLEVRSTLADRSHCACLLQ